MFGLRLSFVNIKSIFYLQNILQGITFLGIL